MNTRFSEEQGEGGDKRPFPSQTNLPESDAILGDFFEYAPDAIVVVDGRGHIVRVNNQTEVLFGYARHELLGQPVDLLLPERFRERHIAYRTAYTAEPRLRTMGADLELFGYRRDHREVPVNIMLSPVTVAGDKFVIAIIRDITDRKATELALRKSEENFELLVNSVRDYAIIGLDSSGKIVSWNRGAARIKRYESEEVIGQHFSLFCTPENIKLGKAEQMLSLAVRQGSFKEEGWQVRKDGVQYWASVHLTPLYDEDNQLVGFVDVTQDLTQTKEIEKQLSQIDGLFQALFEQLPYALFLISLENVIVDVNPAACQLMGYQREELIGMNVADAQVLPGLGSLDLVKDEVAHDKFFESINLHRDGHQIPVEVRTINLDWYDQGLTLSMVQDISARKETEAQIRASLQEKEVMLMEIHHRVKNNLQIVSSLLKLQADYVETLQTRAVLQGSQNRIQAMALVHETLYQSQDLASIDFARYLEQLVRHLRKAYMDGLVDVAIELDIAPIRLDLDTAVSCGLVINELVSNALKYAFPPDSRQAGEISTTLRLDDKGQIKLEVKDNGIGFPIDLDYRQTESLGLQLVNTLVVDELDGTIELDRRHGTLFIITLPTAHFL